MVKYNEVPYALIAFVDVMGFTAFGEKNRWEGPVANAISILDYWISLHFPNHYRKPWGDGWMIVVPLGRSTSYRNETVVDCAMKLRCVQVQFMRTLAQEGLTRLTSAPKGLRASIVLGSLAEVHREGCPRGVDYLGSSINLASRLCAVGSPATVITSSTTVGLLEVDARRILCPSREFNVSLKGIGRKPVHRIAGVIRKHCPHGIPPYRANRGLRGMASRVTRPPKDDEATVASNHAVRFLAHSGGMHASGALLVSWIPKCLSHGHTTSWNKLRRRFSYSHDGFIGLNLAVHLEPAPRNGEAWIEAIDERNGLRIAQTGRVTVVTTGRADVGRLVLPKRCWGRRLCLRFVLRLRDGIIVPSFVKLGGRP